MSEATTALLSTESGGSDATDEHRVRTILTLAILSVLLTGVIALLVQPFDPDRECCDHFFYRSMSYNLFTVTRPDLNVPQPGTPLAKQDWYDPLTGLNRTPPYEYRVLTPLLARTISLATGIEAAYYLISFMTLAGAAFFVALSILELTRSLVPAAAAATLFLVSQYTASINLTRYMMIDPMALFLAALAIWALVKRNRLLFFVTCAVGALAKESLVPLLVAYPMMEALVDRKVRWSSIGAVVGIGICWHLFRVAMPEGPHAGYNILSRFLPTDHQAEDVVKSTVVVYGVMLSAILRRPWGQKLAIALVPFVLVCFMETWFITATERVLTQALPAVCIGIFWLWPKGRREQVLTIALVPLVALSTIAYHLGFFHPFWITVGLSLIAAMIEVLLARPRLGALPEMAAPSRA